MNFRRYIVISVIIHLIILLIAFLYTPKQELESEKPVEVTLIEPKAPETPKPPIPKTKPTPPKIAKAPDLTLPPPEPHRPLPSETDNIEPDALQGGLVKKPEPSKSKEKPLVPKPEKQPEKKETVQKQNKPKPVKKEIAKPQEKPQQDKKAETTQKPKPVVKQDKPAPKSKPSEKRAQPTETQIAKRDPSINGDIPQPSEPLDKPGLETPSESQETPTDRTKPGRPGKKERVNLFDQDITGKIGQEHASVKDYGNDNASNDNESSNASVPFDTTEMRYVGYMNRLRQRIETVWKYPPDAARAGIQGRLYIRFTISRDGSLKEVELLNTSGHENLDRAAIAALKSGDPYWPLPKAWQKDSLTITGHFVYSLGNQFIR
jgi:protein TonB